MTRGRNPKPSALHVVEGTFRPSRHGTTPAVDLAAPGPLVKPKYLKGAAGRVWDEVVPQLTWLTPVDATALAAWCALEAERRADPAGMLAARLTQWRCLMAELGLTVAGRTRIGASTEKPDEDPTDKYFR